MPTRLTTEKMTENRQRRPKLITRPFRHQRGFNLVLKSSVKDIFSSAAIPIPNSPASVFRFQRPRPLQFELTRQEMRIKERGVGCRMGYGQTVFEVRVDNRISRSA